MHAQQCIPQMIILRAVRTAERFAVNSLGSNDPRYR